MRESGHWSGIEVTERNRDHDRERRRRCDQSCRPITTRQGSNLHLRYRTGGVSRPKLSIYTPSHTSTYMAVPSKSLHINQIQTQHTIPRCCNWVQGGHWGATHRKTTVLRIRPAFLCHTRRVGSLPSKVSLREGVGSAGRIRRRTSNSTAVSLLSFRAWSHSPLLPPGLIRFLGGSMRPPLSSESVRREQESRSG